MRRCSLFVIFALSCLYGCGHADSPEAQVRQTIRAMEEAAEARDVGDLMKQLSPQFRDGYGRDGKELLQYVRGYFIANQSVHLLTRIESIAFPTSDEARAKVTVGMVGREAAEVSSWELAAEVHDFEVTFMREDGRWKVSHAKWDDRAR
jgi:hypothetical protein